MPLKVHVKVGFSYAEPWIHGTKEGQCIVGKILSLQLAEIIDHVLLILPDASPNCHCSFDVLDQAQAVIHDAGAFAGTATTLGHFWGNPARLSN